MRERIVFASHNGGLGDALIYSTLPELWVRERGAEVFITGDFRNPGIPELVWGKNPYVSGIVKEPHNRQIEIGPHLNMLLIKYKNNIRAHEAFFGFEPTNDYPRIYWEPGYDLQFRRKVLLDASGITLPYNKAAFEPWINWLKHHHMFQEEQMVMLETDAADYDKTIFPNIPRHRVSSIFEKATAINSCEYFMTNESGGAALASAIKGGNPYPKVCAVITTRSSNTLTWKWANLDYWHTGALTPDF